MGFHLSSEAQSRIEGQYVFLDNDFLSVIFNDENAFDEVFEFLRAGFLIIDPFTRFEFLRDVFLPPIRDLKEKFISNTSVFQKVEDHQEIFKQIKENALILSRLYSHRNKTGVDTVDLLLAAQTMIWGDRAVFITGNKRHFPNFIFDTLGIMNYEDKSGSLTAFAILQFNGEKFAECYENYEKLSTGK